MRRQKIRIILKAYEHRILDLSASQISATRKASFCGFMLARLHRQITDSR